MTVNFATMRTEVKEQFEDRRAFDFYPTPLSVCRTALLLIRDMVPAAPRVLDPGAASGPWGTAAREIWRNASITGIEIRADAEQPAAYDHWFQGSFIALSHPAPVKAPGKYKTLKDYEKAVRDYEHDLWCYQQPVWPGDGSYDLIIGNPPYEYAQEFCERSVSMLLRLGACEFLLRLAFLESEFRGRHFWPVFPPLHVYAMPKRPSFMPEGHAKHGKTDATAYGVFIWQQGWTGETILRWFPLSQKRAKAGRQPVLFGEAA